MIDVSLVKPKKNSFILRTMSQSLIFFLNFTAEETFYKRDLQDVK